MKNTLAKLWHRFFHEERSPRVLGLFRIALGIILISNCLSLYPVLDIFYGLQGIVPLNTASSGWGFLNLFVVLPRDEITPVVLWTSLLIFSLSLTLGLWSRFSAFMTFLLMASFHHRNIHVLNSGDTLMRLFAFFMIFAPMGSALSVDRLIRILKGREEVSPPLVSVWGLRLLQFQFTWVYFCSTVFKLRGEEWLNGSALPTVMKIPEFQRLFSFLIAQETPLTRALTWGSLLIEGLLGTLIWVPALRLPIVIVGTLFHLCIDQLMFIPLFEWIMITGLILFIDDRIIQTLLDRLKDSSFKEVLYDRDCTFCTRWMKVITTLDVRGSLKWTGVSDTLTEVIYISSQGKRFGGFFAFRRIVLRLPTLWILIPIFFFPGSAWIGTRVYQWIADHRYLFMGRACDIDIKRSVDS